ncbi:MAG: zinc ribbon domain-containing protein [Deltaproteobacteria bacterium]|jgi:putative FmdB family regulatory protein|nr:zinc ribbon domain-containing protein [Deltaproteobacteria bacterium]
MPIYEFTCRDCGKEFEELVLKDGEGGTCPSCGAAGAEKRMSRFRSKSGGGALDFDGYGEVPPSAGSGSGCGGCTAASCAGCGVSH